MVLKSVHVCEYHRCVPVWWERPRQGWCIAAIFHAVADVVFIGLRRRWDATHLDVHRTLNVSRQKDLARLYTLYEANRIIKTSWIRFKLFSIWFSVTLSCSSLFLVADITIIVWIFAVNWKSSHIYTFIWGHWWCQWCKHRSASLDVKSNLFIGRFLFMFIFFSNYILNITQVSLSACE